MHKFQGARELEWGGGKKLHLYFLGVRGPKVKNQCYRKYREKLLCQKTEPAVTVELWQFLENRSKRLSPYNVRTTDGQTDIKRVSK